MARHNDFKGDMKTLKEIIEAEKRNLKYHMLHDNPCWIKSFKRIKRMEKWLYGG